MEAATAVEKAIELEGVGRDYGERPALRDVSVSLDRGKTLVLLGANGAGKSTLLRVLAGLLSAQAGRVRVLGSELPREAWRIRARLGYLGHAPLLYRELTARENLDYHAQMYRVAAGRVGEVLERVGMTARADEPVATLSRGLVQRLDACRAVLHEPELLLLDEPGSGLDPAAAEALDPLIGRASGRTRVVTGNDPSAAVEQADSVLGLRAGRVALSAAAGDVQASEIEALYR